MSSRPRHEATSSAVEREELTLSQQTTVDLYAAWRNGNIVAGNGGDRFQQRLAISSTLSA
jgi:hypothetical protein